MHFPRCFMLLLLSGSVLLQACGAAREEPFDPADPEPEPPEPVNVSLLIEDNEIRVVLDSDDKAILVARTEEEYFRLADIYMADGRVRPNTPDMETGQVVFFDAGIVDNRNCARKLQLRTADARGEQTADDVVTLVLRHDNFVPAAGSVCTGDPANVRPYAVFYIESRGDLMVREELR
jgi:hypothetical protein